MNPRPEFCLVEAEEAQACGEGQVEVNVDAHAELGNDLNKA